MLNAETNGKRLGFHEDAGRVQHGEGVTRAVTEGEDDLMRHAEAEGIPRDIAWSKLTPEQKHWVIEGSPLWKSQWNKQWYGIYIPAMDTSYDLNGDGIADTAYRPNGIIDQIVWRAPVARLLLNSPAVSIVKWAQSQFPAILPGGVADSKPLMKPPANPTLNRYYQNQHKEHP